jgi:hypothetical protein
MCYSIIVLAPLIALVLLPLSEPWLIMELNGPRSWAALPTC